MASMMAAAVAAALAVYVAVQAARGVQASLHLADGAENQMVAREYRDGRWMCAAAVAFGLSLAALAIYSALIPGAAEAMEAGSGSRLAALTAGGLVMTAICIRETALYSRADSDSNLYRMRGVPAAYAALVWSALFLGYAVALA